MSNRSESWTGGGAGSGLEGNSFNPHKGESGGSGLKKPEGEDRVKVGSMGVVKAEESDLPIEIIIKFSVNLFGPRMLDTLTVRQ
jgi:hypothetical protein